MNWAAQTRNGTSVRLDILDAPGPYPIRGAVYLPHTADRFDHKGWWPCQWTSEGKFPADDGLDLIETEAA